MNAEKTSRDTRSLFTLHRHHPELLFAEFLSLSVWVILGTFTVLLSSFGLAFAFFLSLLAGSMLVKSLARDVRSREHARIIGKELADAREKLVETDKLKYEFITVASHNLRTPLTVVRNLMSLLLDGTYGQLPKEALENIQQVFDRTTEMVQAVDDYLNISQIERGRMTYEFTYVDLKPVVAATVRSFEPNAEKKGLKVVYHDESHAPRVSVKADAAKVREIIDNLIINAITYTPKGSITVTLSTDDKMARVSVQDTGIGMDDITKRRIFKVFSPGTFSRKINPTSIGIGLYIAYKHAQAHGGDLSADSQGEGRGSVFTLELPIERAPAEQGIYTMARDI